MSQKTVHYIFFLIIGLLFSDIRTAEQNEGSMGEQQMQTNDTPSVGDHDTIASIAEEIPSERVLVNEVAIKVEGPQRKRYITTLELKLPDFDGKAPNPEDLVDAELMYQDALKHKIPVDEYARKHVETIKRQNKINDQQFDEICAQAGLDSQSALEKFEIMGAANTMTEHINSRIFIPFHEVEAYYKEHPVTKESKYQLRVAFIPYKTAKPLADQKKEVEALVATNKQQLEWGDPFWLKKSDLADDKEFIMHMAVGDISVQPDNTGFEAIEQVAKKAERVVPLEKLYKQMTYELRMPKMQESLNAYKKELHAGASVVYVNNQ